MQKQRVFKLWWAVAALSASLTACGGGGGDSSTNAGIAVGAGVTGTGAVTGAGGSSINLQSFLFSSDVVTQSMPNLSVQWTVATTGSASVFGYHIDGYAIPATSKDQSLSNAGKFLNLNCLGSTAGGLFSCKNPKINTCTYDVSGRLSCSAGASMTLTPGAYNIITKACSYDAQVNDICSTKQSVLTVK